MRSAWSPTYGGRRASPSRCPPPCGSWRRRARCPAREPPGSATGWPRSPPPTAGSPQYCPPWLPIPTEPAGELLATGQIAGPLLRAGVRHRWLGPATDFCRHAVERLEQTHPYEAEAAVAFLDGVPDRPWARRQARRLGELVREQRLVLLDPDRPEEARLAPGYAPGEYHLPYDFAPHPQSLAPAWFSDAELGR
ncbi:hypothetical protein [Peterkaempfera bronchialis]|uniref:hypothetical protein n=1 Tax=Peterkaempfera bronchialis TaxID=2126346 RepID=UPI003C2D1701